MKLFYKLILLLFASFSVHAQTKYVTQTGNGSRDGSSWSNAWGENEFGNNLYAVSANTHIWIAAGTYRPIRDANGVVPIPASNFEATFVVPNGVKIYGGFSGNETNVQQRDKAFIHTLNKTVLSGDINTPGFHGDNIARLLMIPNATNGETLDGLSITEALSGGVILSLGAAVLIPPVINNCIISQVYPTSTVYGALALLGSGSPVNKKPQITNCTFTGNFSYNLGAVYVNGCLPEFSNCLFYRNYCSMPFSTTASCIYFNGGAGIINNCTFYENDPYHGNTSGAVLYLQNLSDSIYINNSIFWNNYSDDAVYNINVVSGNNLVSVKNTLFQTQPTGTAPASLINSINTDPLF